MKYDKLMELICLHGCVVKDENGVHIADITEEDGVIIVTRTPACSLGTYMSVLTYLRDLGFDV